MITQGDLIELRRIAELTQPIYCAKGQHYGVHVAGQPAGFCPICHPKERQH